MIPQPFIPGTGTVREIADTHGTPTYLFDERKLISTAEYVTSAPNAYGLTVRYAMKAWPSRAVLRLFHERGIHIDASSGFEVERALRAGIPPNAIQLTGQELPSDFAALIERGVLMNACSIRQLDLYGRAFPGSTASVRINPGLGSGHANRTNTGGPGSSFGIWHERLDEVLAIARTHRLTITGMHTHVGSGSDITIWERCAELALQVAERLPDVNRVSLGGGYKVARMPGEKSTDLHAALGRVKERMIRFGEEHGRKLHLEIEPGTYLVACAGAIVTRVIDVVETGAEGYTFVKIDSGMTEIIRPSLYGAQHPIWIVGASSRAEDSVASGGQETRDVLVVGHCCESGDLLTPAPGDPEGLGLRALPPVAPGDLMVIGATGAYCSGFSVKNYNSFPEAAEVLLSADGTARRIRRRQTLDQIIENESE